MKTQKMFGLLACAAASAVAINAYANTTTNWFSGAAAAPTPSATGGAWNSNYASSTAEAITIDNDYSTALTLTPTTASPARSDGLVTITSTAVLTPCSTNDLPTAITISDAQVGFAVAYDDTPTSNYYYYVRSGASAGTWNKWETPSVPTDTSDTTFTITLDYRTSNVVFTVGMNSTDEIAFVPATAALANVAAFGTGSISSIEAQYEIAVAQYNSVKYGSYAEAVTAAGNNKSSIQVVNSSGEAQAAGEASNGLQKWECAALNIAEDAQVALQPATKQNANKITLATSGITADDGLTVKYSVNGSGSYDADDIQIPMTAGTYTIAPVITVTAE